MMLLYLRLRRSLSGSSMLLRLPNRWSRPSVGVQPVLVSGDDMVVVVSTSFKC